MRIGIFGGSFNPVHLGHIRLARAAREELNLDKIYFVPSKENPLKKKEFILPDSVRIKLLKIAIKNIPEASVSRFEIEKKGSSYTVETLKYFKKKYGKKAVLYFLSGADVLKDIERWRSIDQIFKLCRFVVMTRPGFKSKGAKRPILFLPFSALKVSSTQIRYRLKRGLSIGTLVPKGSESLLKETFV